MLRRAPAKIRQDQQSTTSCEERTMRKIAMIATTAVITALITVWSMYPVNTTSAIATTSTPSLNIMQMMRNAKDLPVESYDACACAF